MMKRMFGFACVGAGAVIFSWATAGATISAWPKPKVTAAARTVTANDRLSSVLLLRFSIEGIWIAVMGASFAQRFPPLAKFSVLFVHSHGQGGV
jgi:hypothetical protein